MTLKRSDESNLRNSQEVEDYNDQVWDMVLYQVHPVMIFVVLQVILVAQFQLHPEFEKLSLWVYLSQFFGAWAVLYGTFLRQMGFRSYTVLTLVACSALALIYSYFGAGDILNWSPEHLRRFWLIAEAPGILAFLWVLPRWLRLKRQHGPKIEGNQS